MLALRAALEAQPQAANGAGMGELAGVGMREGVIMSEAAARRLAEIRSEVAMFPGHLRARIARDLLRFLDSAHARIAELEEAIERTIDLGAKRVNELVAERDARIAELERLRSEHDRYYEGVCAELERERDTVQVKLDEREQK